MKILMRSLIFLFIPIFFLFSCRPHPDDEATENMAKYGILLYLLGKENYVLNDNKNGTVNMNVTDGFGNIKTTYVYKKCLQGQIYRASQNDCQGAGTLANLWNASLLQYCNANDNTCNPTGQFVQGSNVYVFGLNSQIYVSCDGDITAGLKWYPGYGSIGNLFYNATLKSVYPDLPWDNPTGIWSAISKNLDSSKAYFYKTPYTYGTDIKLLLKYVLCGTDIPK